MFKSIPYDLPLAGSRSFEFPEMSSPDVLDWIEDSGFYELTSGVYDADAREWKSTPEFSSTVLDAVRSYCDGDDDLSGLLDVDVVVQEDPGTMPDDSDYIVSVYGAVSRLFKIGTVDADLPEGPATLDVVVYIRECANVSR